MSIERGEYCTTYCDHDGCRSGVLRLAGGDDIIGKVLLSTWVCCSKEGAGDTTAKDAADLASASSSDFTSDATALLLTKATGIESAAITLDNELTSEGTRCQNKGEDGRFDEHDLNDRCV